MNRLQPRTPVTILSITVMLLMTIAATFAAPTLPDMTTTMTPPPPSPTPADELPKPVVMLTIYDPWRMVIGSDEPTFVLYDNGLVIYQRIGPADAPEFASVQLADDEFEALKASLNIDADLYALDADETYYPKTDQPTNVIRLFDDELGDKTVSIYGDLWSDEDARQNSAPKPLIDLFDKLVAYSHPDAQTWFPEQFEVILWPYNTSDAELWPTDWPDLDDPTTIKRDSVYSLYIDFDQYDRYLELRNTANAVRLDGQNWSFSSRFPLPHEHHPA